jgi:cytochrome c
MDSFELNKIAMAVLGTVFAVFGVDIISEAIFHEGEPGEPAYVLAEVSEGATGRSSESAGPAYEPIAPLLASANIEDGEKIFKKCAACHNAEKGGANKVGPNLWNVIGRNIASIPDFSYSSGMEEFGQGKQWTYEELNGFLFKPKAFVSGTAMGFVGLKDAQDRADVIAFLREHSDNPPPLPESPANVAAGSGEAVVPAEGGDAAPAEGGEATPADNETKMSE